MEDFDWVTARCECSPGKVFAKLEAQVKSDVDTRRATLRGNVHYGFSFVPTGASSFTVLVESNNIHHAVKFAMTETGVLVMDENSKRMFSADVTVSDDGTCKLKVDGEEKELWQVRQQALEEFFFRKY